VSHGAIWKGDVTLDIINGIGRGTMSENLGIVVTELGDDWLRGTMPVTERSIQPMRIQHGGANVAFAETLASIAANYSIDRERQAALGQEINANHLRPAPLGSTITGTARAFHIGGRSQVWGIEIVNERGQLLCVARMTMAIVARDPRLGAT
jgi:1,4-dihydroxy-2-naphthoyl-CoA hydrolase